MRDSLRENVSYFGLYQKMRKAKKITEAQKIPFGIEKEQYFLYYAPLKMKSDKRRVSFYFAGIQTVTQKQISQSDRGRL